MLYLDSIDFNYVSNFSDISDFSDFSDFGDCSDRAGKNSADCFTVAGTVLNSQE
jgi:hypothetical protein